MPSRFTAVGCLMLLLLWLTSFLESRERETRPDGRAKDYSAGGDELRTMG